MFITNPFSTYLTMFKLSSWMVQNPMYVGVAIMVSLIVIFYIMSFIFRFFFRLFSGTPRTTKERQE